METKENEAELTIFGDITSWPWLESDISSYNLSRQIKDLDVDTIHVHINSYGGEVSEGLAIYNSLKQHKATLRTYWTDSHAQPHPLFLWLEISGLCQTPLC